MKKLLGWLLFGAVMVTVINDVGRFAVARYDLSVATEEAVAAAARTGRSGKDAGGRAAVAAGTAKGVEVYGYDQDADRVYVWTRAPLEGTWVYVRFVNWRADKPLDTPLPVEMNKSAIIQ